MLADSPALHTKPIRFLESKGHKLKLSGFSAFPEFSSACAAAARDSLALTVSGYDLQELAFRCQLVTQDVKELFNEGADLLDDHEDE